MMKAAQISSIVSLYPLPQYVVVLEDLEKNHLVPIWIGVNEGNAIAADLQGQKFPRPLTHDLMVNTLFRLGVTIDRVIVNDLRENSYYALLCLQWNGKTHEIDARPSDCLAIAVRAKCPIFVEERVLAKCPKTPGAISDEEAEKFKEQLRSMTPEQFFSSLENAPVVREPDVAGPADGEDPPEEKDDDETRGEGGRPA